MNDPYRQLSASGSGRFLSHLNPLTMFAAVLPATVALIFTRDIVTPLVFLLTAIVLVCVGARLTRVQVLFVVIGVPLGLFLAGMSFSFWTSVAEVSDTVAVLSVGPWTLYAGALQIGFATGLRMIAIIMLGFLAGVSISGPSLVRAMVQQLRVPYRVGYAAMAAFRFVPRFNRDFHLIRQAHRVRGAYRRWPFFGMLARWFGYIVPLMATAIRHAERVALAMDARAFGAYSTRTERTRELFRVRDTVVIVVFWCVSAAIFVSSARWVSAI